MSSTYSFDSELERLNFRKVGANVRDVTGEKGSLMYLEENKNANSFFLSYANIPV